MAKFIMQTDGGGTQEIKLGDQNTIGRQPNSTVTLHDPRSSGRHANLLWDEGEWKLRDLGSSNGTFVNGERIENALLIDGDRVQFGTTALVFSTDALSAEVAASQVSFNADSAKPLIHSRVDGSGHETFLPVEKIPDVEQLKQDYEKLRIASELNQAIGLEADVDVLLGRILDEVFNLLPADRGVILLMDPSTHKLEVRATKKRRDDQEEIVLSNTVINEVFGSGAAVLTSDATRDSRFSGAHSVVASGMRSTMCVPMIYRSQLYGIVHLDSLFARGVFSNKDLQILTGLAAQAGRAIDNAYKAQKIEQSALARRDFERLLPPELVEQIVSGKVHLKRGGELRETTVLFSDIRGFTQWTESHQPSHIVSILNDYFELMVDAIHRHHGTLDKFMGDGIMALFGAPISHDQNELNAVLCALDMLEGLDSLNRRLDELQQDPVHIGIGINNGPVIVGYMGSSKSMEYTAIGDHVNLAARLCGVAERGQILLSENTYQVVRDAICVKPLPPVTVKGKRAPQNIYEVQGRRRGTATIDTPRWDDITGTGPVPTKAPDDTVF
ncbi:MAG: FHA domain-containing protein [Myxococcales bacterium]|nr:FHA domain-containing protein [Myxococcales bacterium]